MLYAGKYQNSGAGPKYELSGEVFKRLLFTADIEGIDVYLADRQGKDYDVLKNGSMVTITDERPLFFLYLGLLKCFDPQPVGLNFLCGSCLLLLGLLLLTIAFDPPQKPLYFLCSAILLSPFMVFQTFAFEPHVLQIFLTSAAVFFYVRKWFFWVFFCMVLSFFAHGANLVLLGCLGLYFLYDRRLLWREYLLGCLGGAVAWGGMELMLAVLFARDRLGLLPHVSFLVWFLTKSGRLAGNYAVGSGVASFLKTAFIFLPLGTVGVFWVKDRLQAAITLLPVLLYAVASHFAMPAAFRVMLPMFFLGYAYFWLHLFRTKRWYVRAAAVPLVIFAAAMSAGYMVVAGRGCDLAVDPGTPVALCQTPPDLTGETTWLRWNLRRFHPVVTDAPVAYCFESIDRLELSNVPDPNFIQANLVFKALAMVVSPAMLGRFGSLTPTPPIFSLVRRDAAHGQ